MKPIRESARLDWEGKGMFESKKPKIICAGNHQQFERYCHAVGINCRDPKEAIYVFDVHSIRGLRLDPSQIVETGLFDERKDANAIRLELKVRCWK